jgi:hypothetical protein
MNFQKELAGISIGGYTVDTSNGNITITSDLTVSWETLLSVANISQKEWYYITPGDTYSKITDITSNVLSIDTSGLTWDSSDNFQIIVAVEDTTKDADIASVRVVDVAGNDETEPLEIQGLTNQSANTYFYEVLNDHLFHTLQIIATDSSNAAISVYTTLDEDATVPSTGGSVSNTSSWYDITNDMFSGQTTDASIINLLAIVDTATKLPRYLVEVDLSSGTNTLDIFYAGQTPK